MRPIESRTIEKDDETYRIDIYPDGDSSNPLEDWSEMGSIVSLSTRHANRLRGSVEDLLDEHPDAVPLSYFEHGECLWAVTGELPPFADCPWDSVAVAGFWVPDEDTLRSAKNYGGFTRRQFMRKRARVACKVYTQWCNGDIYTYVVVRVTECPHCGETKEETVESCGGFYGLDECLAEAMAAYEGAET